MALFDELVALAAQMEAAGVPYALCGGLAVAAHGAPRATKDIDLLVLPKDLERAKAAALASGFKFAALPRRFRDGMQLQRVTKIDGGSHLVLDLIVADEPLREVFDSRLRVPLAGTTLWVVSRDALVRMKAAAARPIDLHDIERLEGDDR